MIERPFQREVQQIEIQRFFQIVVRPSRRAATAVSTDCHAVMTRTGIEGL